MTYSAPSSHRACFACGNDNPQSLGLSFSSTAAGGVLAQWQTSNLYQGYPEILHGGIICTLLDAAMTHCMFQQGVEGVTAELNVRFIHAIPMASKVLVGAQLLRVKRGIYFLASNISLKQQIYATATAKFMLKAGVA